MNNVRCEICDLDFRTPQGLGIHRWRIHRLKSENSSTSENGRKQFFGISAKPEVHQRLAQTASTMGLSVSVLCANIIEENLWKWERRARGIMVLSNGATISTAPPLAIE